MGQVAMRAGALAVAALLAGLSPASAPAEELAGELSCMVAGGIGLSLAGKRALSCVYYRHDGRVEFYLGSFARFGLDLGPATARRILFRVRSPQPEPAGVLEGDFTGLGAGATISTGLAADALMGGRGGAIAIMPIANSEIKGLNVNAGLSEFHLQYAGSESRRDRFRE